MSGFQAFTILASAIAVGLAALSRIFEGRRRALRLSSWLVWGVFTSAFFWWPSPPATGSPSGFSFLLAPFGLFTPVFLIGIVVWWMVCLAFTLRYTFL